MATAIRYRHGTTAQHKDFHGVDSEITVDTDLHTLYVHDGTATENSMTQLARADLENVNVADIKNKGILDTYLTNFGNGTYTEIIDGKNYQLGVQLTDYLELDRTLNLEGRFAKANLENVSKASLLSLTGNNTFISYDLSNIRTSILAGVTSGLLNTEKPLAYKDMSNVDTTVLGTINSEDPSLSHSGPNLVYSNLSNLEIESTDLPNIHNKGLQTVDNLININSATAADTDKYPTASSVKTELNRIGNAVKILDIQVPDTTTGIIRVKLSTETASLNIHYLFTDSNISGVWSQDSLDSTIKIFTPLDPDDIISMAWVIKVNQ